MNAIICRAVEARRREICAGLLQDLVQLDAVHGPRAPVPCPILLGACQPTASPSVTFGLLTPDADCRVNSRASAQLPIRLCRWRNRRSSKKPNTAFAKLGRIERGVNLCWSWAHPLVFYSPVNPGRFNLDAVTAAARSLILSPWAAPNWLPPPLGHARRLPARTTTTRPVGLSGCPSAPDRPRPPPEKCLENSTGGRRISVGHAVPPMVSRMATAARGAAPAAIWLSESQDDPPTRAREAPSRGPPRTLPILRPLCHAGPFRSV